MLFAQQLPTTFSKSATDKTELLLLSVLHHCSRFITEEEEESDVSDSESSEEEGPPGKGDKEPPREGDKEPLLEESGGPTSAAAGKGSPQLLKKQLNTADTNVEIEMEP